MKKSKVDFLDLFVQIIGELVCYTPLFLICSAIGVLGYAVLAMITFFMVKKLLLYQMEHLPTKYCVTITYSTFLVITIFYIGLNTIFPFIQTQPFIVIFFALLASLLTSYIGELQFRNIISQKKIAELNEVYLQKEIKPFDCETATEQQLLERIQLLNIKTFKIQGILDLFTLSVTEYSNKYQMEFQSVSNKKQRYKKLLNKI